MSFQTSHLFNVNGLVAVITGGGTGLGLIMAKALALNGAAKVYIVGRRKEVLESAAKESPYGNILPLVGDVTSKDSLEAVAKQITDEVGYINVLIANSGVMGPNPAALQIKDLGQFQEALWKQDFDAYTNTSAVNTTAAYFTVVAFLGLLEKGNQTGHLTQRSQIIITSSISGFAREPTTGYAYGDSKAATTHLTKQLASTLAPFGIRVNALAPGLFQSELASAAIGPSGKFPKERVPLERVGTPEEMAGAILYLSSPAGGYCHGSILVMDGGRLSVSPSSY